MNTLAAEMSIHLETLVTFSCDEYLSAAVSEVVLENFDVVVLPQLGYTRQRQVSVFHYWRYVLSHLPTPNGERESFPFATIVSIEH